MKDAEHQHQAALIRWFDLNHPQLRGRLFAIPNGGQRNKAVAAKLKAEGVRAGVPDLFLPVPRKTFHGLFIELKAGKNKPTDSQYEWLDFLGSQGYCSVWCSGWEAAQQTIVDYLN